MSQSVDVGRDTHHVNWVSSSDLGVLLTAQSYRPAVVNAVRAVKALDSWEQISQLARSVQQGQSPQYAEQGVPCLKTGGVGLAVVKDPPNSRVSHEYALAKDHLRIEEGAVLINRSGAGSIGRAGVYLDKDRPLSNEHVVRLVVREPNDSAFLAAFLASWWGQRALESGVSGSTGQLQLNRSAITSVPVPKPPAEVQRAIGNRLRRAHTLFKQWRSATANIHEVTETQLNLLVPDWNSLLNLDSSSSWTMPGELEERLDSTYYPHNAQMLRRAILRSGHDVALGDCCTTFRGSTPKKVEGDTPGAVFIVRFATVTSAGLDFTREQWGKGPSVNAAHRLLLGDVVYGNAAHNPTYIGKEVDCFAWNPPFRCVASAKLNVLRPKPESPVSGPAIGAFLRHPVGRALLQPTVRAVTANPEDAAGIPLIQFPAEQQSRLGALMVAEARCRAEARTWILAAIDAVGALIEGNLDIDELLADDERVRDWLANNPAPTPGA